MMRLPVLGLFSAERQAPFQYYLPHRLSHGRLCAPGVETHMVISSAAFYGYFVVFRPLHQSGCRMDFIGEVGNCWTSLDSL